MENTTKETSEITKQIGEKIEQNASHWSDILKEVVDKLTGKNMDVTYNFENFEIDVPKATGPDGRDWAVQSGRLTANSFSRLNF